MAYEQSQCVIQSDAEDENSVVGVAKPNNQERNIPTVEDVGRIFRRLMEETLTSKPTFNPLFDVEVVMPRQRQQKKMGHQVPHQLTREENNLRSRE